MRILFAICLCIASLYSTYAQQVVFDNDFSDNDFSLVGNDLLELPGGDILYLVAVYDTGVYPPRLIKTDAQGNVLWVKDNFSPLSRAFINGNMVWDDPYILMVLVTNDTATGLRNVTQLVKLDTSGAIIDSNTIQAFTNPSQLILGQNGEYICAGTDVDEISPGQGGLLVPTIFAFDNNLDIIWRKQYFDQELKSGSAYDIVYSYNGGYAMTVAFGFNSDYQSYLLEVDEFGDSLKAVRLNQDTTASFGGLTRTLDGGYLTVGGQDGNEPLPLVMVQKLDANLATIWSRSYTTALGAEVSYVVSMPDSGYVFCGTIYTNNDYDQAGYLAKVNDAGDLLWETTLPAPGYYDEIYRLVLASNNQLLALGYSEPITGNTTIIQSRIIDTTLTTAIQTVELGKLMLYPNPVTDVLTLELERPLENGNVVITNQLGQEVSRFSLTNEQIYKVQAPSQPGIYYLTLLSLERSYTFRFIAQ